MRILALQGSPRPHGNTQAVLEAVLAAAREAGAHTETIQLSGLRDLTGCRECFSCQSDHDQPACAIADDMLTVLGKALKADLIVWATPVFCWAPAWPLVIAMNRFFCMFKFQEGEVVKSLLAGRKMAAVITAGGGADDGSDLVTQIFQRTAKFSQAQWLGALVAGEVKTPDTIRADAALMERAREFGRKLAS